MIHIPPAMMSQDSCFTSAVGTIRVFEKRLMDRQAMLRLLESRNNDELARVLGDNGYGDAMAGGEGIHDFEIMLTSELKKTYKALYTLSPDNRLIRLFARRYDFHNMKTLLKAEALGEDPESALSKMGEIPIAILREGLEGQFKKVPSELTEGIRSVRHYLESDSDDPQVIDLLMDRAYTSYSSGIAEATGISFLKRLMRIQTDLNNVKTLVRVRKMNSKRKLLATALLPGGNIDNKVWIRLFDRTPEEILTALRRTDYSSIAGAGGGEWLNRGNISELERLSDNFIQDYLQQTRLVTFGGEPLIAYLFNKEYEIKALRIILVGKLNGLPMESIKLRVRKLG